MNEACKFNVFDRLAADASSVYGVTGIQINKERFFIAK